MFPGMKLQLIAGGTAEISAQPHGIAQVLWPTLTIATDEGEAQVALASDEVAAIAQGLLRQSAECDRYERQRDRGANKR